MIKQLPKRVERNTERKNHVMSFRVSKTQGAVLRRRAALFWGGKASGNRFARMILLAFLDGKLVLACSSDGSESQAIKGGQRGSHDSMARLQRRELLNHRLVNEALTHYANQKITTEKIARKFGVSTATLTCWAKRAGIPCRGRGRRRKEWPTPLQQQMMLEAQNGTYEAVAKKYGVTKAYIGSLMTRWHGRRPKTILKPKVQFD